MSGTEIMIGGAAVSVGSLIAAMWWKIGPRVDAKIKAETVILHKRIDAVENRESACQSSVDQKLSKIHERVDAIWVHLVEKAKS